MLHRSISRPFHATSPGRRMVRVQAATAAKGFGAAKPIATPQTCTCGSKIVYKECCQPFHDRKANPATAEAALRARFSGFSKGQVDYLLATDAREGHEAEQLKRDITSSCNNLSYSGLKVLNVEVAGAEHTITFSYKSQAQGKQTKTPIRVGRSIMAKGDQVDRNLDGSIRIYANVEKSKFVQGADGIFVLKASEMVESQ